MSCVHFVGLTTGTLWRTYNLTVVSAGVVYENQGVVDPGGLYWLALDEFDKVNRAMACGTNGCWSTANLSAAAPAWALEIPSPANWEVTQVRSSPVQDGLWMAVGCSTLGGTEQYGIWVSTDDGLNWTFHLIHWDLDPVSSIRSFPCLELSSHDAGTAWLATHDYDDLLTVYKTTDLWATWNASTFALSCFRAAAVVEYIVRPGSCHRAKDNSSDYHALWLSIHSVDDRTSCLVCEQDTADCDGCVTVCQHTPGPDGCYECGCYYDTTDEYWALTYCQGGRRFFRSEDGGASWSNIFPFPDSVTHCVAFPNSATRFVAAHGPTGANPYPLMYSDEGGYNFAAKTGNWAAVGTTPELIPCAAIGPAGQYGLTPIGGGLYPQGMDCDPDGNQLYLALYDVATGRPRFLRVELPLSAESVADLLYSPASGDAINVDCAAMGGELAISGNFAANEQVKISEDAGDTLTEISPGWGVETAQPVLTGEDTDQVMVALAGVQDLVETFDAGASPWIVQNPAIGYSPGAAARLPEGHEMVLGDDAANRVDYSPNRGQTLQNVTGLFTGNCQALEVV